jgi:predicted nucleotidyltransferase
MKPFETPAQSANWHTVLEPVIAALQKELGNRLVAIVLFGSRARGDYRPDSDWDLLVVAQKLPEKPFQRHLYLKGVLPDDWRGKVALLAKTPAELESHVPALYLDIALDGVILYDRGAYMKERLASLQRLIREKGLHREQRGRELIWRLEGILRSDWHLTWGT